MICRLSKPPCCRGAQTGLRHEDIVPSQSCRGIKMVTMNEPHFQGHFPGTPIMPGVTIIEAMAQAAAVLASLSLDIVEKDALVYFMGIDNAKFRRMVVPGDMLELFITVKRSGSKIWKFNGVAKVGDELACEADFTAMLDLREG